MTNAAAQAEAWSEYWSGAAPDSHAVSAARPGEALSRFWRETFDAWFADKGGARLVDLACGAGVAAREAAAAAEAAGVSIDLTLIDIAEPALDQAKAAVPQASRALVGDAAAPPLEEGGTDVVFSQYGVEYAGLDAVKGMARFIAPRGAVIALTHIEGGPIERECASNLAVLDAMIEADLFAKAEALFQASFDVDAGKIAPERITEELGPAYQAAVQTAGRAAQADPGQAGDYVMGFLNDMVRLLQNRLAYEPEDGIGWIRGQAASASAYRSRMRTMTKAALSQADAAGVAAAWRKAGLEVEEPERFTLGEGEEACAWRLSGRRPDE
mgnify:CR=1 FL=1